MNSFLVNKELVIRFNNFVSLDLLFLNDEMTIAVRKEDFENLWISHRAKNKSCYYFFLL